MFAFMLDLSGFQMPSLAPLAIGIILVPVLIINLREVSRWRKALAIALVMLVVPLPLLAADLYATCDWAAILDQCGGSEFCAWAYWLWAVCPAR